MFHANLLHVGVMNSVNLGQGIMNAGDQHIIIANWLSNNAARFMGPYNYYSKSMYKFAPESPWLKHAPKFIK
jgi:hypothetical protein